MTHALETSQTKVVRIQRYHYPNELFPYATFVHVKFGAYDIRAFSGLGQTPAESKQVAYDKALEAVQAYTATT